MNILSVSDPLGDNAYSWRVQNISKQLRAHGHNVRLTENQYLSTKNWVSKGIVLAKSQVRYLGELNHGEYDLVYGNSLATFFCLLGKLKGIPLVFDMHGLGPEEYLLQNASKGSLAKANPAYLLCLMMDRSCLHFSDTIVCVSKSQMRHLNKFRQVPFEKMLYAANGVDLGYFRPHSSPAVDSLRKSLGLEGRITFGYIGGTQKWQGVEQFIATASNLRDSDVGFLVVGGDRTYKTGSLAFVERQPRSNLLEYYAVCDVLVLPRPKHPANEISLPTKFAEYAAVGKPILSTDLGDPPQLIRENDCGIVVADNKTESLIEGVMEFKGMSSGKISQMGARSRALAERDFDWDRIGASLAKSLLTHEK